MIEAPNLARDINGGSAPLKFRPRFDYPFSDDFFDRNMENKTKYVLYIPHYYFKKSEITLDNMSRIIKTSKQLLTDYIIKGKIVCVVVTDELLEPSFPAIHPKIGNEKNCDKIVLSSSEKNSKFYEKIGFQKNELQMVIRN